MDCQAFHGRRVSSCYASNYFTDDSDGDGEEERRREETETAVSIKVLIYFSCRVGYRPSPLFMFACVCVFSSFSPLQCNDPRATDCCCLSPLIFLRINTHLRRRGGWNERAIVSLLLFPLRKSRREEFRVDLVKQRR